MPDRSYILQELMVLLYNHDGGHVYPYLLYCGLMDDRGQVGRYLMAATARFATQVDYTLTTARLQATLLNGMSAITNIRNY